jgi:hypothetical protein
MSLLPLQNLPFFLSFYSTGELPSTWQLDSIYFYKIIENIIAEINIQCAKPLIKRVWLVGENLKNCKPLS